MSVKKTLHRIIPAEPEFVEEMGMGAWIPLDAVLGGARAIPNPFLDFAA